MSDKIQIHKEICDKTHELYKVKNSDYGDSFAQMRRRYPNVIGMKLWEKVNRLCTVMDNPDNQKVKDETVEDTLMDIANYALMELTERQMDKQDENTELEDFGILLGYIDAVIENLNEGVKALCEQFSHAIQELNNSYKEDV